MAVALKQYNIGVTVFYPDMALTEAADGVGGSTSIEFMKACFATSKEVGSSNRHRHTRAMSGAGAIFTPW